MTGENKLIIITAPSGAGKTSITHFLLNKYKDKLAFSVSATTRLPRSNETEGVDYYFISPQSFQQKIEEDAFIEWEMVYENKYYGTLKTELDRIWNLNKTPILDIDVHGAVHVQKLYADVCLSIFIEPPSLEELKRRLESRGTESLESVQTRLNKAQYELSLKNSFNTIITNDDLKKACEETEAIIKNFLKWE